MKAFLLFCLIILPSALLISQVNTYSSRADSDPKAVALLDKLRGHVQKERLQVDFELSITMPESAPEIQKGTFVMQGTMYHITTEGYEIWCDGVSRWVHDKAAREVQWYHAGKESENLSPVALFLDVTGDQYISVMSGTTQAGGVTAEVIELKPVDRYAEISKLRLTVSRDGKPVNLEIFEKSSARTVLNVQKLTTPDARPDTYFRFNPAAYPGVHIEDLRID